LVAPRADPLANAGFRGYRRGVSETGNPITPEDDQAETADDAEAGTDDNPDLDDE